MEATGYLGRGVLNQDEVDNLLEILGTGGGKRDTEGSIRNTGGGMSGNTLVCEA